MDLTSASLVDFAQQQQPQQEEEEVLVPHQELPNGAQPMEGSLPSLNLASLSSYGLSFNWAVVDSIRQTCAGPN
jgi:hypothetical protein